MRVVATLTDRTFYFDHADLCEAWRVSTNGHIQKVKDGDLHYHWRERLAETLEMVLREDGVTYLVPMQHHHNHRRQGVRQAVCEYLRKKFRVKSAIDVSIVDAQTVTARCGHY